MMNRNTPPVIARQAFIRTFCALWIGLSLASAASIGWAGDAAQHQERTSADPPHNTHSPIAGRPNAKPAAKPKALGTLPPAIPVKPALPKIGFRSTFIGKDDIHGERISEVQLGSLAERMKLLPGDVIVAVNGTQLTSPTCWQTAMRRVSVGEGWVTLKVRCRDSGIIIYRTANLLNSREQ